MASPRRVREEKNNDNGFLAGPIVPALLRFAVPVLFALLLQNFYGAFDLWAVGRFCGSAEVSAVSTGSQTMLIVTGIVAGLSMGSTVLLGMRIGEGDREGAACVIGTSVLVFGVLGVLLTAVTVAAARPIAVLINAPIEAMEHTVNYIRICGAGGVFIAAYNLASAIFRGLGNSKAPLLFVAIASAVNVVGDFLLVGVFRMGAVGAAIATTAAQGVSVVLSLALIRRHGLPFPLTRASARPQGRTALGVLRLGAPLALQDMCNEISYHHRACQRAGADGLGGRGHRGEAVDVHPARPRGIYAVRVRLRGAEHRRGAAYARPPRHVGRYGERRADRRRGGGTGLFRRRRAVLVFY